MDTHLRVASLLANALDNSFSIAGFRFGLSFFIDLIPGVGDILDAVLSLYLVWIGMQLHLPAGKLIRMIWNIAVNFVIGLLPFIGDAAYLFRKANMKNLHILREYAVPAVKGSIVQ